MNSEFIYKNNNEPIYKNIYLNHFLSENNEAIYD